MNYLLILFIFYSLDLLANDFSSQGQARIELRSFNQDNLNSSQDTNLSLFTRVETNYQSGPYKHVVRGFGRVDSKDNERSILAIEDSYVSWMLDVDGEYILLAGYKTFNWSSTEVFHIVDSINSRNFDSDFENQEKKGELTVELEVPLQEGSLIFFYFPKFEEPNYPGSESRVGAGYAVDRSVVVDGHDTITNNYITPQFGVRATQTLFDTDISLHYLNHIDRRFSIIGTNNYLNISGTLTPLSSEIVPFYYRSQQIGGTFQQVIFDWIVKFEFANRSFNPSDSSVLSLKTVQQGSGALKRPADHSEAALGLDYLFHIFKKCELNIYLEVVSIFGATESERAELSTFQRDFMVGFRLSLNDTMGREFNFNIVKDIERENESLFNLSYTQRVTDNLKMFTGLRYIKAPHQKNTFYKEGLESFDDDGYYYFHLTRFF